MACVDTSQDGLFALIAAYFVIVGALVIDGARSMSEPHYSSKMLMVVVVSLTWPALPFWLVLFMWRGRRPLPERRPEDKPKQGGAP